MVLNVELGRVRLRSDFGEKVSRWNRLLQDFENVSVTTSILEQINRGRA